MLLHFETLVPHNNLVAIRFDSPVQISHLSVFPTGSSPFLEDIDVVADTQPAAFRLDLFFNAQRLTASAGKIDKPKASNALISTSLAYVGGQRQFPIDWDNNFVTRLMIIRGDFISMTMAVYGGIYVEGPSTPKQNPVDPHAGMMDLDPLPLPLALNPAASYDPTRLARQMLSLMENAPQLRTALQLILCIKPRKDDWYDEDFPFYQELQDVPRDGEELSEILSKPFAVNVSNNVAEQFCASTADILAGEPEYFASTLSLVACQPHDIVSKIMHRVDCRELAVDGDDESALAIAVMHPTIASKLALTEDKSDLLSVRIQDRLQFDLIVGSGDEDFFTIQLGQYLETAKWLQRVLITSERLLGIWIITMLDSAGLSEYATSPQPPEDVEKIESKAEFIAYIRAVLGVGAVLAVLGWADTTGDMVVLTKVLGIIRIWQNVAGYKTIVNRLLTLPQYTVRLEQLILLPTTSEPSRVSLFAEQIVRDLVESYPKAFLVKDVAYTVLSLPESMLGVDDLQRQSMIYKAEIAEGGVQSASIALSNWKRTDRLDILNISLAIVQQALGGDGTSDDFQVFEAFWDCSRLAVVLTNILNELQDIEETQLREDTLQLAVSTLNCVLRCSANIGDVRCLVSCVVNLYGVQSFAVSEAVLEVFDTLCSATPPAFHHDSRTLILLTLINEGVAPVGKADPVLRTKHIVQLISRLLSAVKSDLEVVIVPAMAPLSNLWRLLATSDKLALSETCIITDREARIGIAEWLINEELNYLSGCLKQCEDGDNLVRYQADQSFEFLYRFSYVDWKLLLDPLAATTDTYQLMPKLTQAFSDLCDFRISSAAAGKLAKRLLDQGGIDSSPICVLSIRALFLACLSESSLISCAIDALQKIPQNMVCAEAVAPDVRAFLSQMSPGAASGADRLAKWLHDIDQSRGVSSPLVTAPQDETSNAAEKVMNNGDNFHPIRSPRLEFTHLSSLISPQAHSSPSTPSSPSFSHAHALLVTVSPNSSILRSPTNSLVKTYTGDSFRQLRLDSHKQNTSRLPSMHVDAFQEQHSPTSSQHARSHSGSSISSVLLAPGFSPPMLPVMSPTMHHGQE